MTQDVESTLLVLRRLGIHLSLDGPSLRYRSPNGVLGAPWHAELARLKPPLSGWLTSRRQLEGDAPLPPPMPGPRTKCFRASFAQEGVFPKRGAYGIPPNVSIAVRLTGPLKDSALEESLARLLAQHDVLRSRFEVTEDGLFLVDAEGHLALEFADFTNSPAQLREAQAQSLAREVSEHAFDVAREMPTRGALIRLSRWDHVLVVVMDRLVADARSSKIIVRDLLATYSAVLSRDPSSSAAPSLRFADFAAWERSWFRGREREIRDRYWSIQLSDHSGQPGRAAQASRAVSGEPIRVTIPTALLEALIRVGVKAQTTLMVMLLTAFAAAVFAYRDNTSTLIAITRDARDRIDLADTVGFLATVDLVRIDGFDSSRLEELIAQTRRNYLESLTFAVPTVWEHLGKAHAMFNYLEDSGTGTSPGRRMEGATQLRVAPFPTAHTRAGRPLHPVHLTLTRSRTDISGDITFQSDVVDRDAVMLIRTRFLQTVTQMSQLVTHK